MDSDRKHSAPRERCGFCTDGVYYHPAMTPWAERIGPAAGQKCPYCDGTGEAQ